MRIFYTRTDSGGSLRIDIDLPHQLSYEVRGEPIMLLYRDYVVVDQGGHTQCESLAAFSKLWPKLTNGGLYYFENISSVEACSNTKSAHTIEHNHRRPIPPAMCTNRGMLPYVIAHTLLLHLVSYFRTRKREMANENLRSKLSSSLVFFLGS